MRILRRMLAKQTHRYTQIALADHDHYGSRRGPGVRLPICLNNKLIVSELFSYMLIPALYVNNRKQNVVLKSWQNNGVKSQKLRGLIFAQQK
jgi:hypothetical protein